MTMPAESAQIPRYKITKKNCAQISCEISLKVPVRYLSQQNSKMVLELNRKLEPETQHGQGAQEGMPPKFRDQTFFGTNQPELIFP